MDFYRIFFNELLITVFIFTTVLTYILCTLACFVPEINLFVFLLTQERKKKRRGERKAKRKMYGAGKEGRRRGGKVDKDCDQVNMKCFVHDNDHWKIPPLWKCEFIYLLIY